MKRKIQSALLVVTVFVTALCPVAVFADDGVGRMIKDTAAYIYETVPEPSCGSVGGEWAVIGLARSGVELPDAYYRNYYKRTEEYVKDKNGVLHARKYTEYSRVILALTAIGKDPSDVAGYNLLKPLADYEKVIWQGINGPIWALIALDSGNYVIPNNPSISVGKQATREMYVERILACQLPDGGWSLFGGTPSASENESSDPDITAMALTALARYRNDDKVSEAAEKALECLSRIQRADGGYSSGGANNLESSAQVLVALCSLGIDPDDARFVKNGNSVLDAIKGCYTESGGFVHVKSDKSVDGMSTEQGFYSLVALQRYRDGMAGLYNMNDTSNADAEAEVDIGLENKASDVRRREIIFPGKSFDDTEGHPKAAMIEALAARGIVSGRSEDSFEPNAAMTRAEYAAIIVKGLGLPETDVVPFSDVTADKWFYGAVGTAYSYGIVNGVGNGFFNPYGTITFEEATVMTARAAKLCGADTAMSEYEVRMVLSAFDDHVAVSEWARNDIAFCFANGIIPDDGMRIEPKKNVTRAQIAEMLYGVLRVSELL